MTDQVTFSVQGTLGIITLRNERALNALTLEMIRAIAPQLHAWAHDDAIGAVLVEGAGEKAFCAGGDVKAMGQRREGSPLTRDEKISQLKERQRTLTGALTGLRKPTVAALPGPAASPTAREKTSRSPKESEPATWWSAEEKQPPARAEAGH